MYAYKVKYKHTSHKFPLLSPKLTIYLKYVFIFIFFILFGYVMPAGYFPAAAIPFLLDIHDVIARPKDVTSYHPTRLLSFLLANFTGSTGGVSASSRTNLAFSKARPLNSYWLLGASPQ